MKYGFVQPFSDPLMTVEYVQLAEAAGWDGFFVWEAIWGIDAWVTLGAAAAVTHKIYLGTMITPLSRMRPWKLASETLTLDHLSNGRAILSVGLGALDTGFEAFGEVTDRKTRAELLDEGLEIVTGLWRGQPIEYNGKHYHIRKHVFGAPPATIQQPRIPIWVVAGWPSEKSMARGLRYDGLLPNILRTVDGKRQSGSAGPDDIRAMRAYVDARRGVSEKLMDIIVEGETPEDEPEKASSIIKTWEDAGATWWLEARWNLMDDKNGPEIIRRRIVAGPPR